jgi:hypothetical protein
MRSKIYFTAILMIAICGCGEKATKKDVLGEVIHINPHEAKEYVNLSEIADSIICIRLQPAPDDVMGRIGRVIVGKKYIYAEDFSQRMIFVFDKTGQFVSKLDRRGEGQGEYSNLGPLFIDDNEEYIEFIDLAKGVKFKYTNISFEFVETAPLPKISFNVACRRNDGFYYYATHQMDNDINDIKTNAGLVVVDAQNNIKTLFDKNIETNNFYPLLFGESFTQNDKNELFFSNLYYDNTFYRLKAGEAYPVYTVDFGKYGMDNQSVGALSTQKQVEYLTNMQDLASFPMLNVNNSGLMSFSYFFKQESGRLIPKEEDIRQYVKIKDKVYHVKKIRNDLTKFPDRLYLCSHLAMYYGCPHEVWYEDYLVDVIETSTYFANSDVDKIYVEGLGDVTSDEEIIVVLMKLKK